MWLNLSPALTFLKAFNKSHYKVRKKKGDNTVSLFYFTIFARY